MTDAQAARILKETFPDRAYTLGTQLGAGGQGCVWALRGAGQPAVCKIISTEVPKELALGAEAAKRFQDIVARNAEREVESLKRFSESRHFPTLLDSRVYVAEDGTRSYIIIEEQLLPLLPTAYTELKLSPRELAIRVGLEVSGAICELVKQKRTHRDIKIPNLFLRFNNNGSYEVVVSDLGASKEAVPGVETIIGTPGHIPPERLHRRRVCSNTGTGDVYSLGVTLLEIFTGKDLYIPEEAVLANEIAQQLELVKAQDPALGRLLEKMVRQQPFFRPSPAECRQEFRKLLPAPSPELHRSGARRAALAAFRRGDLDEAKHLAAHLPANDARRYLLLALISDSHSERVFNLRLAGRLGSPAACYYLGEALLSGENGVKSDAELSLEYLRCAAKANYTPAVYRLHCLKTGKPLPQDTPKNRIAFLMEEIAS